MVREGPAETIWARLHARQALVFGLIASLLLIVVLAFPLLVVIADPAISTGMTIVIYGFGLATDVLVSVALIAFAVRCAARAARGELFAIPVVTPIVDTVFRLARP